MDYTPTAQNLAAREVLARMATATASQAAIVKDTGPTLNPGQRQALERLIEAAREAERQLEAGK